MIKKILKKFGYIHKDDIGDAALYALRFNVTKKVVIHNLCRQLDIDLNEYICKIKSTKTEEDGEIK